MTYTNQRKETRSFHHLRKQNFTRLENVRTEVLHHTLERVWSHSNEDLLIRMNAGDLQSLWLSVLNLVSASLWEVIRITHQVSPQVLHTGLGFWLFAYTVAMEFQSLWKSIWRRIGKAVVCSMNKPMRFSVVLQLGHFQGRSCLVFALARSLAIQNFNFLILSAHQNGFYT